VIRGIFTRWRRQRPIVWDIRITSPDADGYLVDIDTEALYFAWRFMGGRSTDGYLDLLAGHRGRLHVWIKPTGWVEPDSRLAALDGTGAVLPGSP
jgi:hypothetical protein